MLDGKICIVTGSGGGIGRATAVEMARQGARAVMVSDIDDAGGEETLGLVREAGGTGAYTHCDVEEADQIRALIDATVSQFGGIDVLHNNAGVQESYFTSDLAVDTLPEEVWDKVYRINLRAVWLATKYAAPHLRRSERTLDRQRLLDRRPRGLSAVPGLQRHQGRVLMLTKSTAVDLAPAVRCNCYCPGAVDTYMVQRFREVAEDVEALERTMTAAHLIPRLGRPEEVAKLVCFLASDDAASSRRRRTTSTAGRWPGAARTPESWTASAASTRCGCRAGWPSTSGRSRRRSRSG